MVMWTRLNSAAWLMSYQLFLGELCTLIMRGFEVVFLSDLTDRLSTGGNAVVPLSVCPSVSTPTFEPSDLWPWPFTYAWVMTVALPGLKVKVRGQGQTSDVEVRGGNAVLPQFHFPVRLRNRYGRFESGSSFEMRSVGSQNFNRG